MEYFVKLLKNHRVKLVMGIIGGLAGYIYWAKIGCISGTCAIWSNPFIATGYGAMLGFLIGGLVSPARRNELKEEDASADSASDTV